MRVSNGVMTDVRMTLDESVGWRIMQSPRDKVILE